MPTTYSTQPGAKIAGEIHVPGDKSISHRALMLASIAEGTTQITGLLEGKDVLASLQAFRAMGVEIEGPHEGNVTVKGVGKYGLKAPSTMIDCGNSGTTMRLLCGLLSGQSFATSLMGDHSLSKRPMRRVVEPLSQMGAHIEMTEDNYPPLNILPVTTLQGITYKTPVASAQVKSAILLAGLYAKGKTTVSEIAATRDHTERMLKAFEYPVEIHNQQISLTSEHALKATAIKVPCDISSAAFFMVAAAITRGSDLLIKNVGINPTRTGVIDILKMMGANISIENERMQGGEPTADIHIRYAELHGITIPAEMVPRAIDEFPALFIAAANAEGETILTGAKELRVKESDRIQVMAEGLSTLGIDARPTPDGIHITGGKYSGGSIDSHGDHRIAMAFTVAGICAKAPIYIENCDNVDTSFPDFIGTARKAGIQCRSQSS
jgi:3-phosphoshikimate 1-carboxyvinyltransferase